MSQPHRTEMISDAPEDWVNVAPGYARYRDDVDDCVKLILDSTSASNINSSLTADGLRKNIERRRATLWLYKKDGRSLTVAFHTLEGPTHPPGRHPKFCLCAGVDRRPDASSLQQDSTYDLIRRAVLEFAKKNEAKARLYLWVEGDNRPVSNDRIYPLFEYAIAHESKENEGSKGVSEDYSSQKHPARWPKNLRTWRLKQHKDA